MVVLVLSVVGFVAAQWLFFVDLPGHDSDSSFQAAGVQLLCFGVVGAILIARRPDLPFGWLLILGAGAHLLVLAVVVPSIAVVDAGRAGQLALWGVCLGALAFVPDTVYGLINVRFPSGQPAGRAGRVLDRSMRIGIVVALIGGILGDQTIKGLTEESGHPTSASRPIDGTLVADVGNALTVLVPLIILLGVFAGIGVVIRCVKAEGIERRQLQWRAGGAIIDLALFPLAIAGLLPAAVWSIAPLIFVATLMIPVLRYQLWEGDVPTRRRTSLLVSRRRLVEAREDERRRLRRDLHDGLGPLLTGLRLNLDAVEAHLADDPDKAAVYLANARNASADVITDLRNLVHDLRPPAIDELGLVDALRMRVSALADEAQLDLTLTAPADLSVSAAVEVAIYRTVTESVTNVIRHSSATRCRVVIEESGADVVVTVDDDGRVADTWHAGVGLNSMRERAVELGGTFLAGSAPDGFRIRATYPRRGVA